MYLVVATTDAAPEGVWRLGGSSRCCAPRQEHEFCRSEAMRSATRARGSRRSAREKLQIPFPKPFHSHLLQSLMKKLKPLGDRVLVKRAPKEVKTASGIYLPDAKKPNEGEVVAVGPGERDVTGALHVPTLQPGDNVLLPEYGGTQVDDEHVLFRESDILGKYE